MPDATFLPRQGLRNYKIPDANHHDAEEARQHARASVVSDVQGVKHKLKELFIHYAAFGDRLNTEHLKSMKLRKMMQDAGVLVLTSESSRTEPDNLMMQYGGQTLGGSITDLRLDLLFCQLNNHHVNMPFEIFLQTLTKVAEYIFPNIAPSEAL